MLQQISLQASPVAFVVADALARSANGQQPAQLAHLPQGVLKLFDEPLPLFLGVLAGGDVAHDDQHFVFPAHHDAGLMEPKLLVNRETILEDLRLVGLKSPLHAGIHLLRQLFRKDLAHLLAQNPGHGEHAGGTFGSLEIEVGAVFADPQHQVGDGVQQCLVPRFTPSERLFRAAQGRGVAAHEKIEHSGGCCQEDEQLKMVHRSQGDSVSDPDARQVLDQQ